MQFDLGTLYNRMTEYYVGIQPLLCRYISKTLPVSDFQFPTMFIGAPLDEVKRAKLSEAVGWLNVIMEGREYAAADHFTIADLTLLVTISQLEAFGFDLKPYKHIRPWLERCKEHMAPYDYEELNGSKAMLLADMFKAKIKRPADT